MMKKTVLLAAVLALGLGWLIATLSSGGTDSYFGLLCLAVFRTAYTLQGICLLLWLEEPLRQGRGQALPSAAGKPEPVLSVLLADSGAAWR